MSKPTLFICLQCGSTQRDAEGCKLPNPASAQLAQDVEAELSTHHPEAARQIAVQLVRCLSHCKEPIAWGLRGPGLFAYTFAPAVSAPEIADLAARWLTAPHQGRLPKKEMAENLRPTLKSRLHPLPE